MLSKTGLACCRLDFREELLLAMIARDAIPTVNGVSNKSKARANSCFGRFARAVLIPSNPASSYNVAQASLPRGVLERILNAFVVSVRRRC